MLGFTTRDHVRVVWGDSDIAPLSDEWAGGRTITLQGAAICNAADKMRKDLLARAANALEADAAQLQMRDGVISSTEDPKKNITFAALAKANNGLIRQTGRGTTGGERTALNKGVGTCFVEVEVDTWTGNWRFVRAVYAHDTGLVINPLVSESDMVGSLVESTQVATEPIPWDREFPGTRHYSVGYLSYRLPTIMDIPKSTQVYIDSLEPRWFYGVKSFSETSIGAVPGAISNAIYNACGVRIREHPITREKIMAGLAAQRRQGMKNISIYRPTSVEEAIEILSRHGTEAGVYAGGTDLLIRLKNRLKQAPSYLVDIKQIDNLRYIKEDEQGGVQIGAATKIAEVADSDLLKKKYPMFVQAVNMISSPELRNASTSAEICCRKSGASICAAGIPAGETADTFATAPSATTAITTRRWADDCATPFIPGDAATALIPYDARAKLATPAGVKELSIEQLVPGDMMVDGRIQSHVVRYNEILTEVVIPPPKPDVRASFEKLRPRGVWDFAMASLAMSSRASGADHWRCARRLRRDLGKAAARNSR